MNLETKRVYDVDDCVAFLWRGNIRYGRIVEVIVDSSTSSFDVFAYNVVGTFSGDEYFLLAGQIVGLDPIHNDPTEDPVKDYDRAMRGI